jgi:hypothetical protein
MVNAPLSVLNWDKHHLIPPICVVKLLFGNLAMVKAIASGRVLATRRA